CDLVEEREPVVVELARLRPLQDRRKAPLQLPGVEEELPVDKGTQCYEVWLDRARAGERRSGDVLEGDAGAVRARRLDRQQRLSVALRVLLAEPVLQLAVLAVELARPPGVEQARDGA